MLGCFLNPEKPFSSQLEKIAVAVDLVTIVVLVTLSAIVLSGILSLGSKVNTLTIGIGQAVVGTSLLGLDIILCTIKRESHKKNAASQKPLSSPASNFFEFSAMSVPFEESLILWVNESSEEEKSKREAAVETIKACYLQKTESLSLPEVTTLPDIFNHFFHITSFSARACKLQKLPSTFFSLSNLKKLDLTDNRLELLSNSFDALTNLEVLNLSFNKIVELPNSFFNLRKLRSLNLSYNNFAFLPLSFGECFELEDLDLSANKIRELPDCFESLTNLKKLNLYWNKIECFCNSFFSLNKLEHLILSSNKLKQLPDAFGNLKNLKVLRSDYNQLESLPDSFSELRNLNELLLNNNKLTAIPLFIFQLPYLENLAIFNNCISETELDNIQQTINSIHAQGRTFSCNLGREDTF